MEKAKVNFVVLPIVMSLICLYLGINAGFLNAQLNNEKVKTAALNAQVVDLETQLAGQIRVVRDLQSSLNIARQETENLRLSNRDLETRLKTATAVASESSSATIPTE